jgi:FMN phosphatase YigB (HAD superfamily)
MIRAIFFDFYSVWTPDRFSYYLANAQLISPEAHKEMYDQIELYYHGTLSVEQIAQVIASKLGHPDVSVSQFSLSEGSISPDIVNFIRDLHAHFLKIGILANLGGQEYNLLKEFNEHNQMFEAIACPLTINPKLPLLSREVFSKAIEGIGEEVGDCLYISGNPYNLQFANLYGLSTLQFEGLSQLKAALNQVLANN